MSRVAPTPSALPEYGESAGRVLDVAERLMQQRGFNGFSYADIATELGVTKPSLHYHFATKADLGVAVISRYTAGFDLALRGLAGLAPREQLAGYAACYRAVLAQDRMCLCGMLAAEFATLPAPMQAAVFEFFAHSEVWLQDVLRAGQQDGTLHWHGSALDAARMIIDCLEGSLLVARPRGDLSRFDHAAESLLATLTNS